MVEYRAPAENPILGSQRSTCSIPLSPGQYPVARREMLVTKDISPESFIPSGRLENILPNELLIGLATTPAVLALGQLNMERGVILL